jgi:transcriptional regulator with XRE-family HTH domain
MSSKNLKKFEFFLLFFSIIQIMGDDAAIFWENVKREIKNQNTTQDWVAKKAGISFNTFQGWIAKGIFPRVNEAARIASALAVTIDYLVSGAAPSPNPADPILRQISGIERRLSGIRSLLRMM